jgi:uncharacterized protein
MKAQMKIILNTIILFFIIGHSFGQDQNEKLYKAISDKDTLSVKSLLENNASPNFKKKVGFVELSLLILAVQNNDFPDVKMLVDYKAEIDWRDAFKSTALMYAAFKADKNIILYLVKHGADVSAKDDQGNSVLSAAKEGKRQDIIDLIDGMLKAKQ